MIRPGFPSRRIRSSSVAALLALTLFLSGCGGSSSGSMGSNPPPTQTGPNAILNGVSLAAATSHWVSARCNVQVELTSDKAFWSIVLDNSGKTSSGNETWTVGPDSTSVMVGPGTGLGGFFWVSALGNITGSISSQTFTANVSVKTVSASQSLGVCTFTLAQKGLS